ncbi:DUF1566 domain-containing protein [Vibrio vulnificus]|uniref:Lcl C-terminal domain-containing protein n=1 Tax=Vibrio vulnificus TaxID=672 RepID=UPI003ED9E167
MKKILLILIVGLLSACQPMPIAERYYVNSDGTVLDKHTGLIWMRCSIGQSWDGETCIGEIPMFTWQDAINFEHHYFAGSTGWRLPTVNEINSLVYCTQGRQLAEFPYEGDYDVDARGDCLGDNYQRPTINVIDFPNTGDRYWSSSNAISRDKWMISFIRGSVGGFYPDSTASVRLVRSTSPTAPPEYSTTL